MSSDEVIVAVVSVGFIVLLGGLIFSEKARKKGITSPPNKTLSKSVTVQWLPAPKASDWNVPFSLN